MNKYKLNLSERSVKQMPTMEEPNHLDYKSKNKWGELDFISEKHMNEYGDRYEAYNQHLASLNPNPILIEGEIPEDWKDGDVLEEGKDIFIMDAKDARIFSDALGISHKVLPLKGTICLALTTKMIPPTLDSNPLAFYDPAHPISKKETAKEGQQDELQEAKKEINRLRELLRITNAPLMWLSTLDKMPTLGLLDREGVINHVVNIAKEKIIGPGHNDWNILTERIKI